MTDTFAPNILLVDDSATTRAMIKRIIGMIDLPINQIIEAPDGSAGLACLEKSRVDLILADLNMPVMDGFEMIERIRQNEKWKQIPIVVISAQPDPARIEWLTNHGVMNYLSKPFTAESARSVIAPLLESPKHEISTHAPREHGTINLTLAEALAEALETMAFVSPKLVENPRAVALPTDSRTVRVQFKGHGTHGSLSIAASNEFAAAIASNLDVPGDHAPEDALKELANVTCGLLLRMRPGGGAGFQLEPPQISSDTNASPAVLFGDEDVVELEAEGQLVAAQIIADDSFYKE